MMKFTHLLGLLTDKYFVAPLKICHTWDSDENLSKDTSPLFVLFPSLPTRELRQQQADVHENIDLNFLACLKG